MTTTKPDSTTIDYLCWNDECPSGGLTWPVLVDAVSHEPLDEWDLDCPMCGAMGMPEDLV